MLNSKITLPSFTSFIELFFPKLCVVCQEHLSTDSQLCITCQSVLPETDFHLKAENELLERFAGRVLLESAFAMYYFSKASRVQSLIHQIKYKGNQDLGFRLGAMYGETLKGSPFFKKIDMMLPIPLHPKRQRQRGYNQSEMIVRGLAQTTQKSWSNTLLLRTINTTTQTKQSRIERFNNVKDAFVITNLKQLEGKHILLIDDVITTGATIEACVLTLQKVKDIKISIAAVGFATHF